MRFLRCSMIALLTSAAMGVAATARAEERSRDRFEVALVGGYGAWLNASRDADPPGNPFGVGFGARAGVFVGGERFPAWLGVGCMYDLGTTTLARTEATPPYAAYDVRTRTRIDTCSLDLGAAYRHDLFLVRVYGTVGGARESTSDEQPAHAAGALGGGAAGLARVGDHLAVGLDVRMLMAGFGTACEEGCSGGPRSTLGGFAIVAVTF